MSVFWNLVEGLFLLIIGVYNVWLSLSRHFDANPLTDWLSRLLGGVGRARTLVLVLGAFCMMLGVVGMIFAVTGTQ
jgi:hypothetical protein